MALEQEYPGYEPKENPKNPNIVHIPRAVGFYLGRLEHFEMLRESIDRGEYDNWYSANRMRGLQDTTDAVSIPPYLHERGMRWGVLAAISGTRNILARMGYKKEADAALKIRRLQKSMDEQYLRKQFEGGN